MMFCFDPKDVNLYGDFYSEKGSGLFLELRRCDPDKRATCKTDEEIDTWLDSKYIWLADNK